MNEQKSIDSTMSIYERSSAKKSKSNQNVNDVKPFSLGQNKITFEKKVSFHKKYSNLEKFINSFKENIQNEDFYINEDLPFKKCSKPGKEDKNHYERDGRGSDNSRFNESLQGKDNSSCNFLNNNNDCLTFKESKLKNTIEIIDDENIINRRELLKFNNVYDSFSDDEIVLSSEKGNYYKDKMIIDIKIFIDYFNLIIVLLSCIISPLFITFGSFNKYYEIIFEICFLFEVVFSFFTPYYDVNDNLITKRSKIFKNYIEGYFTLDFLSGFPHQIMRLLFSPHNNNLSKASYLEKIKPFSSDSVFQWTIICRLLKLLKNDTLIEFKLFHNYKINRLIKSFSIFIYLIHFSSCFWIYLVNKNDIHDNWIINAELQDVNNYDLYVSSLYFNSVTIFTVGYGDIIPRNVYERLYNIFLLFFGVMLYTFAVSSVSSIFMNEDSKKLQLLTKIEILENLQKDYKLPDELNGILKQNIFLDYKRNFNEMYEFLDSLPSNIKNTLTKQMYRTLIKDLSFFKGQSLDFILFVLPFLKPHKVDRGKILFSVGELVEEMYFVITGTLSIHLGGNYENLEIGIVRENNHFGELLMQTNEISPYELKCKTRTAEVFMLKKNELIKIKNSFSEPLIKIFQESYKTLETIDKRRQQFLRLYYFENSVDGVKRLIKKLNLYLMERDFDEYYYKGKEFKDVNDFIIENDFEDVIKILKGNQRVVSLNSSKESKISKIKNKNNYEISQITNEIKQENIKNNDNSHGKDNLNLHINDNISYNTNINVSSEKGFSNYIDLPTIKLNGVLYQSSYSGQNNNNMFSDVGIQDNSLLMKSSSLGLKNNKKEELREKKINSLKIQINENESFQRLKCKKITNGEKRKTIFENFRKNFLSLGPNVELVKVEQDLNEKTLNLLKFTKDTIRSKERSDNDKNSYNASLRKFTSKNEERDYSPQLSYNSNFGRFNSTLNGNKNSHENKLVTRNTNKDTQSIPDNQADLIKSLENCLGNLSEGQKKSLIQIFSIRFNSNNKIETVNDFELTSKITPNNKHKILEIHSNETFSINNEVSKPPDKRETANSSDIRKDVNILEKGKFYLTTDFVQKNMNESVKKSKFYSPSKINTKKIRFSVSYKIEHKQDFNELNAIANTSKRLNEMFRSLMKLSNLKIFNNSYHR